MSPAATPLRSPLPDQPMLQGVPDARRAPLPLFEPVTIGVLALMIGAPLACILALLNGLQLRRLSLIVMAAVVGPATIVLGQWVFEVLVENGLENISLLLLGVRLLYVAAGLLLGWQQWLHVKGHALLGGRTVPAALAVGIALGAAFLMPGRLLALIQFPWLIFLDGGGA